RPPGHDRLAQQQPLVAVGIWPGRTAVRGHRGLLPADPGTLERSSRGAWVTAHNGRADRGNAQAARGLAGDWAFRRLHGPGSQRGTVVISPLHRLTSRGEGDRRSLGWPVLGLFYRGPDLLWRHP